MALLTPAGLLPSARAAEPLSQADQGDLLLNAARRAYNDRNYNQAVNQFREFTQKFDGHKDIAAGWYGLGLSLLDGPRDHPAAAEALKRAAAAKNAPDWPMAAYFYGVALRGIGDAELKAAADKPAEAEPHKATAKARYTEAVDAFSQATGALEDARKSAKDDQMATAVEWVARSRCDQADALIRAGKPSDVEAALRPVLDQAPFAKSKLRALALYHLGHARFDLKEYTTAGRALRQLAPFNQEFGPHARYLLARVHHLAGERPEAEAQYKAILAGVEQSRKDAQQKLQQAGNTLPADQKAFLESLAGGGTPDYIRRTAFYQAVLLSDEGKFSDARELLVKFYMENKDHPLANEARLRAGFCQLQSKQYGDAIRTLEALKDDPQFGDQAMWWLARAQVQGADQNKPEAVAAAAKDVLDILRKAADKAQQLTATDPAAKARRAGILLELADAQVLTKQYKEAAATYLAVVNENAVPERTEEAAQRQVTALHLAGDYTASDAAAEQFGQKFPKSTLLAGVLFRSAENAYLSAVAAAEKGTAKPEVDRLFNNAILRYQKIIQRFPEFQYVQVARLGMAQSYCKLGKFDQALPIFAAIPDAERSGDLAIVAYLQADALIRTFPPETEDALAAAGMIQTAEQAGHLMENFVAANPKSPLVPDAMLKQGYCYERMAGLLAERQEHDKSLQVARETFEKHLQQFRNDATGPAVVMERAKTMALQGDVGGAMNDLRRFRNEEKLKNAPNAPLAALRLASLYRSVGQTKEAIDLLEKVRAESEATLLKDPERADWASMLAYEHALAVKESGKAADARKMFDEIAQKNVGKPEAVNGAWRSAQCRREELVKQIDDARKKLNVPGIKPEEAAAAIKAIDDAGKAVADAAVPLEALIEQLTKAKAPAEQVQRVTYELAWCDRTAGEAEAESARQKARREALEKLVAKLPKPPAGQPTPTILAPDVVASTIPPQPGEVRAKDRYQKVIAAGPDRNLAVRARFELAELVADRGGYDPALDLLNAALLAGPPQELADRIRLRMAACFLGKGDGKTASAAVKPILDAIKPNTPQQFGQLAGEARFLQAEAMIQQQDWNKAIELLQPFREREEFRSLQGIGDRAMLRLGQAYARANQWQPSQQAFEMLVQRFPQSVWAEEARFGVGFAMQNQNRLDEAINVYTDVTRRTAAEVAARAQVHIGLCRIAQKKFNEATTALLSVPYTYDYPEWSAAACYEAARAFNEQQKPKEAAGLWKRVIEEYPNTKSAPLAKAKLDEIK